MNTYIQSVRAPFAAELKNPVTAHLVVGAMITEDAAHPIPVLESLFNRTLYVRSRGWNKTLIDMVTGGFYGPYNRHRYPQALAELAANPHMQAVLNDAIDQVLAGSNVIRGFTDQGLPTDPNGWRTPRMWINGEVFNDWAGGPGGPAAAETWRQDFLMKAAAADAKIGMEISPAEVPWAMSKRDRHRVGGRDRIRIKRRKTK